MSSAWEESTIIEPGSRCQWRQDDGNLYVSVFNFGDVRKKVSVRFEDVAAEAPNPELFDSLLIELKAVKQERDILMGELNILNKVILDGMKKLSGAKENVVSNG